MRGTEIEHEHMMPWIAAYYSADAPAEHAWLAAFYLPRSRDNGEQRHNRMLVFFLAPTEDEVREKAKAFWDEQVRKECGSAEARKAGIERRKAHRLAEAKRKKEKAA